MDYLAIAAAGFLGAAARAAVGNVIMVWLPMDFPVGTLVPNLLGCFLLSLFMNLTLERLKIEPRLRLAVGTGFLGAYTTFSTFAVESVYLIETRLVVQAVAYIVVTPLGCLLAAWLGLLVSRMAGAGKNRMNSEE